VKVSIIIPNFNRAQLIGETIDNMLAQQGIQKEIIVVDDGSTDDSQKVLNAYGDRIRWFSQANQGPGAARNLGLTHATGDFVQFMDSDDLASQNKIEDQLNCLETSSADIANEGKATPEKHILQEGPLPPGNSPLRWHLTHWSTVIQACLFRKSIIEKAGGFPQNLWIAEDQHLIQQCMLAGAKLVHAPNSLTLYRLHDTDKLTTTGTSFDRKSLDWTRFLLAARQHILEKAPTEGDPIEWPGYRARLRACYLDLRKTPDPAAQDLIASITELISNLDSPGFKLRALKSRLWRGLKSRMGYSRENSTFATAPVSAKHLNLINELGYQIAP